MQVVLISHSNLKNKIQGDAVNQTLGCWLKSVNAKFVLYQVLSTAYIELAAFP